MTGAPVDRQPTTHPTTYRAGLIGSGISTSASPCLHEREVASLGRAGRYTLLDIDELKIEPADIGPLLRAARNAGWQGLNVTHPCKLTVIPYLDDLSPDARQIGAVNTVVFTDGGAIGHNTDWSGYAHALRTQLPGGLGPTDLTDVVLLGAGGAGSAVGHALLSLGTSTLHVVDARADRATSLSAGLQERFPTATVDSLPASRVKTVLATATGIVNTSPIGMVGHPGSPVPIEHLRTDIWVNDIVYRPRWTPLLAAADRIGCRILGGGPMVAFQAAHAIELIADLPADRARMLSALPDAIADGEAGRAVADRFPSPAVRG